MIRLAGGETNPQIAQIFWNSEVAPSVNRRTLQSQTTFDRPSQRAFTLVEMMVALAVTGVLTVMMLQMFSDSSTIWKTEDDRLDTFREARAALQLMTRDFAAALPLPQAEKPPASLPPDPSLPTPPWNDQYPALALRDTPLTRTGPTAATYFTSAYLLTSAPNTGRGDLCAVGYFLEWEPSIKPNAPTSETTTPAPTPPPRTAFALRRQLAQSDTTFARLRETLPATPKTPFFGKPTFDILYSTLAPNSGTGSTKLPAPKTETIGTYIWDLQFAVSKEPPPPPGATPSSTPAPGKNGFYGTKLPSWVEIRFKALGSTAARKLAGNPSITEELWTKPSDPTYLRLIMPAEQQFVSRVKLAR